MGKTIACAARVDGKGDRGTALLETEEVIFRGNVARVRVPFAAVRRMDVRDGWLAIAHLAPGEEGRERAERSLELELGTQAATWEEGIRSPKGLVAKLGVKSGAKVAILGMKDESLAADLAQLGATVAAGGAVPRSVVDVIIVRVSVAEELTRVKGLAKKIAPDGALWIVRRRGKGEDSVAESAVLEAGRGAGLVDVKVAKWSEVDTGMKFAIPKSARAKR